MEVKDAFRNGSSNGERTLRPIFAKLEPATHKLKCRKDGTNLEGPNIYNNEDFSRQTMQIRSLELAELKCKRNEE